MSKIIDEFKTFMMRGNVVDMAVGIVIGGAFTGIVKSLVADVIMPPIGILMGGVDFSNLFVTLKAGAKVAGPYATLTAAKDAGAVTMNIGLFINSIISFLIVGIAIFMLVKVINSLKKKEDEAEEVVEESTTRECPYCITEISKKATKCPHCTADVPAVA